MLWSRWTSSFWSPIGLPRPPLQGFIVSPQTLLCIFETLDRRGDDQAGRIELREAAIHEAADLMKAKGTRGLMVVDGDRSS